MAKKTTLTIPAGRKWSGYKITGYGAAGSEVAQGSLYITFTIDNHCF
jgi:hypothetical protein